MTDAAGAERVPPEGEPLRVEEIRQQCIVGPFSHFEHEEWIQACRDLLAAYDALLARLRAVEAEGDKVDALHDAEMARFMDKVAALEAELKKVEAERDEFKEVFRQQAELCGDLDAALLAAQAEARRLRELAQANEDAYRDCTRENGRLREALEDEYEWQATDDCACHCCRQRIERGRTLRAALTPPSPDTQND